MQVKQISKSNNHIKTSLKSLSSIVHPTSVAYVFHHPFRFLWEHWCSISFRYLAVIFLCSIHSFCNHTAADCLRMARILHVMFSNFNFPRVFCQHRRKMRVLLRTRWKICKQKRNMFLVLRQVSTYRQKLTSNGQPLASASVACHPGVLQGMWQ